MKSKRRIGAPYRGRAGFNGLAATDRDLARIGSGEFTQRLGLSTWVMRQRTEQDHGAGAMACTDLRRPKSHYRCIGRGSNASRLNREQLLDQAQGNKLLHHAAGSAIIRFRFCSRGHTMAPVSCKRLELVFCATDRARRRSGRGCAARGSPAFAGCSSYGVRQVPCSRRPMTFSVHAVAERCQGNFRGQAEGRRMRRRAAAVEERRAPAGPERRARGSGRMA